MNTEKMRRLFFYMRIIFLSATALIAREARAQNAPSEIDVTQITLSEKILNKCTLFCDSLRQLAAAEIPAEEYFTPPPPDLKIKITDKLIDNPFYIRFSLRNCAESATTVYFSPGLYFTEIDLYKQSLNNKQALLLRASVFPKELSDSSAYRSITLQANESAVFFAKLQFVKTSINFVQPSIIRDYYLPHYSKKIKTPANQGHIISYIIVGILSMMVIYSLAVFILNRSKEFFYYAIFALLMAALFFLKSYMYNNSTSFNHFFESYLDMLLLCAATFFYLLFIRKFIDTPSEFPFLNTLFSISTWITVAGTVFFSALYITNARYRWLAYTEDFLKYSWTLSTIIFIIYGFYKREKFLNYLAIGHLLYLIGIVIALLLMQNSELFKRKEDHSVLSDSLFFTQAGLTLELICFLLALAFKNRRLLIEKTRERERLKMDNERNELEKQLAVIQAKQEERNRISTDMHDELGSGVTAIRLMSEIVRSKMKENTLPEIEKISNSANELHGKMNTIIWTMSSSNDRLDNLIAYIRSHAFEYLENTNIECHFTNPEIISPLEISGEKRRNIYLCIKETLNNTVKYAKATEVWMNVIVLQNNLTITVQDNGIGINKEKLRMFSNGLMNMQKRMESINGTFAIENKNGTLTTFVVPL